MSEQLPCVVQHAEEHKITTVDWINGSIIKLEQIIYDYELRGEDVTVTVEEVTHELRRSQRYMQEIIDLIKYRRPT